MASGYSMVRFVALTLTLSLWERENSQPVGPVSEAPPGGAD
ncbi:hypothetical protein [Enterobacter quasiroggenkampii]|nr:hypothetical protein [Enterobacter quasiroggenkampii]